MDKVTADKLIDKTRDDYNLIAEHFASTRKYNWPDIEAGINQILSNYDKKIKIKVLDVGCGSGRVYDFFAEYNVEYTGLDISKELIKIAKNNYPKANFMVGDATKLPLKDNGFDIVISIATIHHIPTRELRNKAVYELYRVCKSNGHLLVSIWYFWNKPKIVFSFTRNYIIRLAKNNFSNNNILPFADFYKPWKTGEGKTVTKRYFHAWRVMELRNALDINGFSEITTDNTLKNLNNLILTARKP